eukprot:s3265_g19.t1
MIFTNSDWDCGCNQAGFAEDALQRQLVIRDGIDGKKLTGREDSASQRAARRRASAKPLEPWTEACAKPAVPADPLLDGSFCNGPSSLQTLDAWALMR